MDRLPEIPIELFDKDILLKINNRVGQAVIVDQTTMSMTRERFANVCVQIDLRKQLVPFIEILGHLQKFEYEGLHIIFFECGGYGHRKDNCPKIIRQSE